jgi:hypothetical protein
VDMPHALSTAPAEEDPEADAEEALAPRRATLWQAIHRGTRAVRRIVLGVGRA